MNTQCQSALCHGSTSSSGIDLSIYEKVKAISQNGTMMKCILHDSLTGYKPMPPTYKLDSCAIKYIGAWVQQGCPDN